MAGRAAAAVIAAPMMTKRRSKRSDSQPSAFTREVTQTLEPVMRSQFPAYMLTLRFTNIDLAGRRSTGPRSVRVVSTRHPARLSFNYVLQDKSGHPAASGSQTLVQTSPTRGPSRSGPLDSSSEAKSKRLQEIKPPLLLRSGKILRVGRVSLAHFGETARFCQFWRGHGQNARVTVFFENRPCHVR